MPRGSAAACWPTSDSSDLIAGSVDEYVEMAVELASDLDALATTCAPNCGRGWPLRRCWNCGLYAQRRGRISANVAQVVHVGHG